MINLATAKTENSSRAKERKGSGDAIGKRDLKTETEQVLSHEIAFIPNREFPSLDDNKKWRQRFIETETPTEKNTVDSSRNSMPAHLQRLCATPLLTAKEEQNLFLRMNYLRYRANCIRSTLDAARPNKKKLRQVEELYAESLETRNQIVQANTRLVISIVKSFTDEHNSFDDLLSEGIGCLVKAVEKFDVDRGFRFSTYATSAVRREVIRLIRRKHRDRSRFVSGSDEYLGQQEQQEAEVERTSKDLRKIDHSVAKIVKRLDVREQFIVNARYGFIDVGGKPTFSRLGDQLGVSKERVRQLESRAMGKLRDLIQEYQLGELDELV